MFDQKIENILKLLQTLLFDKFSVSLHVVIAVHLHHYFIQI